MTDTDSRPEQVRKPIEKPPPARPSYERVAANLEKWANSSGLQKPT